METIRSDSFPGSLRLLFEVGTIAGMSDGELLDRFLARRTVGLEAAEVAFGAIVERHGPMVLRVCRARLGDEHDAQDAFQATFLILARKAGSIRNRESAASWLRGVAHRVATCARRASAVRRAKERAAVRPVVETSSNPDQGELVPAVREEVGDLPEKYRTPLLLCLLDGLTHEEAATRLGWPVGTVKTRVRQAKDRLRTRLTRRGFAPTLGAIIAALTAREAAALPLTLIRTTARAAVRYAAGKATIAGAASASVVTLVELGIGSLIMSRIKILALLVTALGACAVGTVGYARQGPGDKEKAEPVQVKVEEKDKTKASTEVAKVVDGIDQDLQLEALKIDVDILQNEVLQLRNAVSVSSQKWKQAESSLRKLNKPKPTDNSDGTGTPLSPEAIEKYKKDNQTRLETAELDFKTNRALLLAKNRELKEKEEQLARFLERENEAASIEAKKRKELEQSNESNRLDRAMAASLKLDMLRSEVEFWKDRVFSSKQALLDLSREVRNFRKPYGMTEKEYDSSRNAFEQQIVDAASEVKNADNSYKQFAEALVSGERELRELTAKLSPESQAQYLHWQVRQRPPSTPRPAADIDRRISEVERKLDQILKALEARPAGK